MEEVKGALFSLYQRLQECNLPGNVNTEILNEITFSLEEIYRNPNSLFAVIDLIQNAPNVRNSAISSGLGKLTCYWWKEIVKTPDSVAIKEQIAAMIFAFKDDELLSDQLIHSVRVVIMMDVEWAFAVAQGDPVSQAAFRIYEKYLSEYDKYDLELDPGKVVGIFQAVFQVFQTNQTNVLGVAASVFAGVCHYLPPELYEQASAVFSAIVQMYSADPSNSELAEVIKNSTSRNVRIFNPAELFSHLVPFVQTNPDSVFIILRRLISQFGNEMLDVVAAFIPVIHQVTASMYTEGYPETDDDVFAASTIEKCAKKMPPSGFMQIFVGLLQQEGITIPMVYALTTCFYYSVEYVAQVVDDFVEPIMGFLGRVLECECPYIQIKCLSCIGELVDHTELFEKAEEVRNNVIQAVIAKMSTGNPDVVEKALLCIASILYKRLVPEDLVMQLAPALAQLGASCQGSLKSSVIMALCNCIFSLEERCTVLAEIAVPLLMQGVGDGDSDVVCVSIRSIGHFVSLLPDEARDSQAIHDMLDQFLKMLVGIVDDEECAEIQEAGFWVMSMLAKTPLEIDPFVQMFVIKSQDVLNSVLGRCATAEMHDAAAAALDFLATCVKYRREALGQLIEVLPVLATREAKFGVKRGDDEVLDEDIVAAALKLGSRVGCIIPDFLNSLGEGIMSESDVICPAAFKALSQFLKLGVAAPDELFGAGIAAVFALMKREHPYFADQDPETVHFYPEDVMPTAIGFLSAFAQHRTAQFPIADVCQHIVGVAPNVTRDETCKSLTCVISYISNNPTPDPGLYETLTQFAFSLINPEFPEPLVLLRAVITAIPQMINSPDQLTAILGLCESAQNIKVSLFSLILTIHTKVQPLDDSIVLPVMTNLPHEYGTIENVSEFNNALRCILAILAANPAFMTEQIGAKLASVMQSPRSLAKRLERDVVEGIRALFPQ